MESTPSLHSSKASLGGRRQGGKSEILDTALGLDEELEQVAALEAHNQALPSSQTAAIGSASGYATGNAAGAGSGHTKEKKLGMLRRPRTRDRDADAAPSTPTLASSSKNDFWAAHDASRGAATPSQELAGFSLDTNFDQIDDFVDISVRRRNPNADGLVGPLNDNSSGSSPPGSSPRGGPTRSSSTSFSTLPRPHRQSSADRIPLMQASARTTPATQVSRSPPQQQIDIATQRPTLQKLTKSQLIALRKDGGSTDWASGMPLGAIDGGEQKVEHAAPPEITADNFDDSMLIPRKDSVASGRSDHSGVSPKTSYAQLPGTRTPQKVDGSGAWQLGDDAHYAFPGPKARASAAGSALGIEAIHRRSSASASDPAHKKASNWMAPDSWAVQPDKSRAFSMEEEQDSDDDADAVAAVVTRRNSSSEISGVADRPGRQLPSQDGGNTRPSTGRGQSEGPRRLTQESALNSGSGESGAGAIQMRTTDSSQGSLPSLVRRPSDIEIIQGPDWQTPVSSWNLSSATAVSGLPATETNTSPTTPIYHRPPSGRGGGGALAVASGAASSAAIRLGFRAPTRSGKQSRPHTAGSAIGTSTLNGARGSLGGGSADDDLMSASTSMSTAGSKDTGRTAKRPGTATGVGMASASKPVSVLAHPNIDVNS